MSQIITKRPRDCLACRLISGSGLIGVGAYVGYHGYQKRSYSGKAMIAISTVAAGLGIARLLNLPPFDKPLFSKLKEDSP